MPTRIFSVLLVPGRGKVQTNSDSFWMRPIVEGNSWKNLLRDALVVLALPADDQIRVNGPGCIACDLLAEFDHARTFACESASAELSDEQRGSLERIQLVIESMQASDRECFNDDVVRQPAWQELRGLAGTTLRQFGWEGATISPFIETEPGVWERPPSDKSAGHGNYRMAPSPAKDPRTFVAEYTSDDERFIRFEWNGKHGDDLEDPNGFFRGEVLDIVVDDIKVAPMPLVRDLFRIETAASRETWAIDDRVSPLGEHMLRHGADQFIEDYIEGKHQTFDAWCGAYFECDLNLARHLLQVVQDRLQAETDERKIELLKLGEKMFTEWTFAATVPTAPLDETTLQVPVAGRTEYQPAKSGSRKPSCLTTVVRTIGKLTVGFGILVFVSGFFFPKPERGSFVPFIFGAIIAAAGIQILRVVHRDFD